MEGGDFHFCLCRSSAQPSAWYRTEDVPKEPMCAFMNEQMNEVQRKGLRSLHWPAHLDTVAQHMEKGNQDRSKTQCLDLSPKLPAIPLTSTRAGGDTLQA